jgi:hypothetical protein
VLGKKDLGNGAGEVTFRLVGVKNITAEAAYARDGGALFSEELSKKDGKIRDKVLEITRTLLIRKKG